MKINNRIIYNNRTGIIIDIIDNRCKIKIFNSINKLNKQVETWVCISDLKLDIKYYRKLKLNRFLESTF